MPLDKNVKQRVLGYWRDAFPQLSVYSSDKLLKTAGPILMGLDLVKLPRTSEYRPHFVMYPLWRKVITANLERPIILKQFFNSKNLQINIPYQDDTIIFAEAIKNIEQQVPLSFDRDIALNEIFSAIESYAKNPPLSTALGSYLQALLYEAKFYIGLYVTVSDAAIVLSQIDDKKWDANHFRAFNVDLNEWLRSLRNSVENREAFLSTIERNRQDKKIQLLKSSQLTV